MNSAKIILQKILKEKYLKSGSILFVSTLIAHISSYFFQFSMSRILTPKDYGAMNSLYSLFYLLIIPASVAGTVIVRYVSQFRALGEPGKTRLFFIQTAKNLTIAGVVIACALYASRSWIAGYLQLDNTTPILAFATLVFFGFISPLGTSFVQALQLFARLGLIFVLAGFIKLIFGIFLVFLGLGSSGALLANTIAFIAITPFFYQPLKRILYAGNSRDVEKHTREILQFSIPVMFSFLSSSGLLYLDLILVKHFFTPEASGQYAAAVILARSIYYFPGAFAMAMYPMAAEAQTLNRNPKQLLKKCLLLTFVLCTCGMAVFFIFPQYLCRFLYGLKYPQAGQILPYYALTMTAFAMTNVFFQFNLALKRFKFIYAALFILILEWLLIGFFHNNFISVLWILNICQWVLVVIVGLITFMDSREGQIVETSLSEIQLSME